MLSDRVVLVTGMANQRSLATAVARACAAQGAQLVCTWQGEPQERRVRPLIEAIQPGALGCRLEVGEPTTVAACMAAIAERHGRLDGLLHAIAYGRLADAAGEPIGLLGATAADWEQALAISARSFVELARAAQELLSEGSHLLALTYEGARRVHPGYDLMGVAKAALEQSVRQLAWECGLRQVHVNAISAGSIRTLAASGVPGAAERRQRAAERAPLGGGVRAEEVGRAAAFLLSPQSDGISGQVLHVDAGLSIMGA